MFLTYLARELRRRSRQAIVVAAGLAVGIALVVTVSAASSGVRSAQAQVLHSLYGVGTDVSVTGAPSPTAGGPQRFGFAPGSVPAPGTHFSRTRIRPTRGQGILSQARVGQIERLSDVNAARGSLSLSETSISGTLGAAGTGRLARGGGFAGGGSAPSFSVSRTSLLGVQPGSAGIGPLTPAEISKGRYFAPGENTATVAIASSAYAQEQGLSVGSTTSVDGTSLSIVGIASLPPSSSPSDLYLPLGEAQRLAGLPGEVTTISVSVVSAADVTRVQGEIERLVPGATVTTAANLAKEVTGSLASASTLATNLGTWLSAAALLAAFLLAALLMLAAVSRRVRELGTLKALGWRTRRIMGQVTGEGLAEGVAGAVIGVVLGLLGAALVSAFSPALSATVGPSFATAGAGGFPGSGAGGAGGLPGSGGPGAFGHPGRALHRLAHRFARLSHTVVVHLHAPVQADAVGLAVGLAILGGLVAGAAGSWRAARLSPAAALRRVE